MDVNVFVIIVTYKGKQWYDRCFNSLLASSVSVNIVVVDNASEDGSVEYIKERFPIINVIESKENLGFGRANNIGMRYAFDHECDYVFLLNQDAWVEVDTIETLVKCHKKNPSFGVISPVHMTGDGKSMNFLLNDGNHNRDFLSDLYCGTIKDLYTISYVNAAAWLMPRMTLEKIGGFCPIIFHYGEDDDYLNRLRYHHIKIGLCPSTKIFHDTRNRLDESIRFFQKANVEKIDEYLDITKDVNLFKTCSLFFKKMLCNLLKGDMKAYKQCFNQLCFLVKHKKAIKTCRAKHKVLQANWL